MPAVVVFISTAPQYGPVNDPFFDVPDALYDLINGFYAAVTPTPADALPVLNNSDSEQQYLVLYHHIQALRVRAPFHPVRYPATGMRKQGQRI